MKFDLGRMTEQQTEQLAREVVNALRLEKLILVLIEELTQDQQNELAAWLTEEEPDLGPLRDA